MRITALHGGGFSLVHPQGGSMGSYKTRAEAEQAAAEIIATVEMWYDRCTRSWVIQRRNAAGDQVGNADYVGTKAGAIHVRDQRRREVGQTV